MFEYLSEGWFGAVADCVDARTGSPSVGRTFTVEYVLDGAPDGCARGHTQTFVDDELVGWEPGLSGRADLTVRRTYDIDKDDLLSRGHPRRIAEATEFQSSGVPRGDVFGVEACHELADSLPSGLEISFALRCPDTAVGLVEHRYLLRANRLQPMSSEQADVSVAGPYRSVLQWFHHEEVLLGHLVVGADYETRIDGDYFRMSALEGCVSAPQPSSSSDHAGRLATYADCRHHVDFTNTIDQIDAITR